MPAIKRTIAAATQDALSNLKFSTQSTESLVTLFASSATAGEDLSYSVDSQEFIAQGEINLESGDRVVDNQRDGLLFEERVPAGQHFLSVPVVAGDMTFLLIIEPIPEELG